MRERLRIFIEAKKINKSDFAKQVGIVPSYLSLILSGQRNLNDNVLSSILLANPELNPHWLLTGEGEMLLLPKPIEEYPDNQLSLFEVDKDKKTEEIFGENDENYVSLESNISNQYSANVPKMQSQPQKKIKKIVFFFEDKTFEEYYPE